MNKNNIIERFSNKAYNGMDVTRMTPIDKKEVFLSGGAFSYEFQTRNLDSYLTSLNLSLNSCVWIPRQIITTQKGDNYQIYKLNIEGMGEIDGFDIYSGGGETEIRHTSL